MSASAYRSNVIVSTPAATATVRFEHTTEPPAPLTQLEFELGVSPSVLTVLPFAETVIDRVDDDT